MEKENETRRRNLIALIGAHYDTDVEAAKALNINRSVLSQIRHGKKPVGIRIARKVEEAFGLPRRALDREDFDPSRIESVRQEPAQPGPEDYALASEVAALPDSLRIPTEFLIRAMAAHVRQQVTSITLPAVQRETRRV